MSRHGGTAGMQYMKKTFTNYPGDVKAAEVMSDEERERLEKRDAKLLKDFKPTKRVSKKLIPFGDRVMVRKVKVGDKVGSAGIILSADHTKDLLTDKAVVVALPELTFVDERMIASGNKIIDSLATKAEQGDSDASVALIKYRMYFQLKSLRVGDEVMLNKYCGTDFFEPNNPDVTISVVNSEDILGMWTDNE